MSVKRCPQCNRSSPAKDKECWNCGGNFTIVANTTPTSDEEIPVAATQKNPVNYFLVAAVVILSGIILFSFSKNSGDEATASIEEVSTETNPEPVSTPEPRPTEDFSVVAETKARKTVDDFMSYYQQYGGSSVLTTYDMKSVISGHEFKQESLASEIMNYSILNCNLSGEEKSSDSYSYHCVLKLEIKTKGDFWRETKGTLFYSRKNSRDSFAFYTD